MTSRTADDRSNLSIGEVLSLLQDEFPDVTISKIRFLESQGLLDPERTPSGYRKFYEADIERLRWILRQQKENFLPLKVIKEKLAAGELEAADPVVADGGEASPAPPVEVAAAPAPAPARPLGHLLDGGETSVSLSADELAGAAGLSAAELADLERYGLLVPRSLGDSTYYDDEALVVARLARQFLALGLDARHLRMYKVAAEREAGFYEQLVMPRLKQRRPGARSEAMALMDEAATLGQQLHGALLRRLLRDAIRPT